MSDSKVVLPAPVLPMIAVTCPGRATKEMSDKTGASAPGYWKDACRSSTVPRVVVVVTGSRGGTTEDSVSSTSVSRSAHTAARGTRISMKVAIRMDMRICIR
jgi:hypothetical protein